MVSSYSNCQQAFAAIKKNVGCGFYSTNGDVAKDILNKQTVQNIGDLVVVDHYVKTAAQLGSDLQNLHNEFGTNVFLGEFGAPIPDIHGNLTESQQAELIGQMFSQLYQENNFITGVNYWVLAFGSTSLLNQDGSPREVYQIVKNYYDPGKLPALFLMMQGRNWPGLKSTRTKTIGQLRIQKEIFHYYFRQIKK